MEKPLSRRLIKTEKRHISKRPASPGTPAAFAPKRPFLPEKHEILALKFLFLS
jgi:hypothetical protein